MYIEIQIEDFEPGDEHMVGRLYGTRDAAQNWTREYTEFLESIGFRSGLTSPCNFYHKQKELFLTFLNHLPNGGLELDTQRN